MNSLLEKYPTTLIDNGVEYTLNTHFTAALWVWKAHAALECGEIDPETYMYIMMDKLYLDPKPDMFNETAAMFAAEYLNQFNSRGDEDDYKSKIPPIDIDQDADMIYSSLLSMGVKIDSDLTYQNFLGYLRNLPENSEYVGIMHLRKKYYEERHKMKPKERADLMKDISRIGRSRVLIRNSAAERQKKEDEEIYIQMVNAERAKLGLPPKS